MKRYWIDCNQKSVNLINQNIVSKRTLSKNFLINYNQKQHVQYHLV